MVEKTFKILSIDGGGIRGIIPAMVLAAIEEKTGKKISEIFDLIVGTSTGGILTLGLTLPQEEGSTVPKLSAKDIVAIYENRGHEIFKGRFWSKFRGLFTSSYAKRGLEKIAKETFQEARLSDVIKPVIVTSYDAQRIGTYYFNSREVLDPDKDEENFLLRDIIRATSAAPTYFVPFQYNSYHSDPSLVSTFIDGGVFANNPAMLAYVEAKILHDKRDQAVQNKGGSKGLNQPGDVASPRDIAENFFMLSLGTGSVEKSLNYHCTKFWGWPFWAKPIVDILMESSANSVDFQVKHLLPPKTDGFSSNLRYLRLSPPRILKKHGDMANANTKNIQALKTYARDLIQEKDNEGFMKLDLLCNHYLKTDGDGQ